MLPIEHTVSEEALLNEQPLYVSYLLLKTKVPALGVSAFAPSTASY